MRPIMRVVGWVAVLCASLCAASLLWWWLGGEHDAVRLTDCFTIVGTAVAAAGFVSWVATLGRRGRSGRRHPQRVDPVDTSESSRQEEERRRTSQVISIVLGSAGALTVGIGWLAYLVWS